tara:strand:- start:1880 stop:2353 length:474 start_codon:yes stop_codon:yes gene_type:complete
MLKQALIKNINILTIILLSIVIYLEIYRFIFSIFIFRLILYIKTFDFVKERIAILKKDQHSISTNWKEDKDLIFITKFCRFLYLIGSLAIFYFVFEAKKINTILLDRKTFLTPDLLDKFPIEATNSLYLGLFIILFGIILTFIAEMHIIFYSNIPLK